MQYNIIIIIIIIIKCKLCNCQCSAPMPEIALSWMCGMSWMLHHCFYCCCFCKCCAFYIAEDALIVRAEPNPPTVWRRLCGFATSVNFSERLLYAVWGGVK